MLHVVRRKRRVDVVAAWSWWLLRLTSATGGDAGSGSAVYDVTGGATIMEGHIA
jgi:hypothetical protein